MTDEIKATLYALIDGDMIIDYPLKYEQAILACTGSMVMLPIVLGKKPTIDTDLQLIQEEAHIFPEYVYVGYFEQDKSLGEYISQLYKEREEPLYVSDIDDKYISHITAALRRIVIHRLNAFARIRGYKTIDEVCMYVESQQPILRSEALCAVSLRDTTWREVDIYIDKLINSQVEIPRSAQYVKEILPELIWNLHF
jgi:hypothetical protein